MRWAVLFVAIWCCSIGCDSPVSSQNTTIPQWPALPPGARAVPTEPIEMVGGISSGFQQPARVVIDNQQDWGSFWETYEQGRFPKTDPPAIDFERNQIIAGIMGQRNTGGYDISIAGVFESTDGVIVRVLETSPGRDCAVIQAVTSPVTAVRIPRSQLAVEFVDAGMTLRCN